MRSEGLSERRSCFLEGLNRATYQYNAKTKDDGHIRERSKELAARKLRYDPTADAPNPPGNGGRKAQEDRADLQGEKTSVATQAQERAKVQAQSAYGARP